MVLSFGYSPFGVMLRPLFRTCSTPRFTGEQLPRIFEDETLNQTEWDTLYCVAEQLIGTSTHEFDQSIRHNLVLKTLQREYPNRNAQSLPLACHRYSEGSPYVYWHSAAEVAYSALLTVFRHLRGLHRFMVIFSPTPTIPMGRNVVPLPYSRTHAAAI